MKLTPLFLSLSLALASAPVSRAADDSKPLAQSTQLILVTTADWNAVDGRLQRYQRANPRQSWRPVGAPIAIVVGKTGLAWGSGIAPIDAKLRDASDPVKKEGDGKSPAGVFALGTAFGFAANKLAGTKLQYMSLAPSVECVDDSASKYYNRLVDRASVKPDWNSSEKMRATGEAYRWGIFVDHNANPPVPRGGSCIFLHIWKGPGRGTVGCTAMPQPVLESMLKWVDPARKPLLVQLPAIEYERLKAEWRLPALAK